MTSRERHEAGQSAAAANRDPGLARVGKVLAGRYRIDALIGRGGAGAVYRARDLAVARDVALKLLYPHLAPSHVAARFLREARLASALEHPGIIRIHDHGTAEDGSPFLAMELLRGMSVHKLVSAQELSVSDAVGITLHALRALAYAHDAAIVHRDLKPGNLFLVAGNKGPRVKILDFGMAKILTPDEPELTRAGQVLGTPGFMSPEQLKDSRLVDPRTDIYGMGAVLYFMLVGRPPVRGRNLPETLRKLMTGQIHRHPRVYRVEIPESLDAATSRALDPSPLKRPQSAREFSGILKQVWKALPAR